MNGYGLWERGSLDPARALTTFAMSCDPEGVIREAFERWQQAQRAADDAALHAAQWRRAYEALLASEARARLGRAPVAPTEAEAKADRG